MVCWPASSSRPAFPPPARSRSESRGVTSPSSPTPRSWPRRWPLQIGEVKRVSKRTGGALQRRAGTRRQPAYPRQEVVGLIAHTGEDLDQAIERVGPAMEPLRAWTAEELGRIQEELAAPPGQTAALPSGLFTPRAVHGRQPRGVPAAGAREREGRRPASGTRSPLRRPTGSWTRWERWSAGSSSSPTHDDLEVKLWVGSTRRRTPRSASGRRAGSKGPHRHPPSSGPTANGIMSCAASTTIAPAGPRER